jgi:MSHA biogenesis protein MshL
MTPLPRTRLALALPGLLALFGTTAQANPPPLAAGWRERVAAAATTADLDAATLLASQPPAAGTVVAATAATPVNPPAPAGRFDMAVHNAPAAQVFMQLGQGSAYNMLVAPEVAGSVSLTLRNTTVLEALEALREMYGYEFRVAGNRVYVHANNVQTRLYKLAYLPGRRQGASDTRVSSSAITQGSSGNSASSSGGSPSAARADDTAHVRTTSDADFWRDVQASLVALVGSKDGRSVIVNTAAGVVVVKASALELRQVEQYLKAVQLSIERQVMLEAKVVEVQLSRDAQTGINWSAFGRLLGGGTSAALGVAAPGARLGTSGTLTAPDGSSVGPGAQLATGALGRGFYGLALQTANFAALLNFLQTQGEVQVLSSPRIATLNNQKAVLKVGSDELYVTGVTSSTTTAGNNAVSTPSLTLQPFFSGIALDVTPHIDENGMVMLHVHPAVSTVQEKTKNVDLGSLGAFKLPLAASTVNETDSIVRVRDGQIVAIGGLMKQEVRDEKTGVPVASDMPLVGGLFRQTQQVLSKRELVILLKPTVIRDDGHWPDTPTLGTLPQ